MSVTREIYRGRIVDLRVERVRLPNGVDVDLEIVRHIGAAAVAAVDDDGAIVLIRQWRHAAGGWLWEIPAGLLDAPDEPPHECAARELREETGFAAAELTPLGQFLPTPGFCDERVHLFLARGLRDGDHAREHDEVIAEIRRVPLREAVAMVRRGEIVDGKTVAGVFWAAIALGVAP